MTKRTRVFMAVAVGVIVAGLGTGLFASYMGFQGLTIVGGNGPDELAYIPADAKLVGFADVRAVMNSELRQKFRELHPQAAPNGEFTVIGQRNRKVEGLAKVTGRAVYADDLVLHDARRHVERTEGLDIGLRRLADGAVGGRRRGAPGG